jgi:hypothetical protein
VISFDEKGRRASAPSTAAAGHRAAGRSATAGVAVAEHIRHRNSPAERARGKLEAAKRHQRRTGRNTPTTFKLAA